MNTLGMGIEDMPRMESGRVEGWKKEQQLYTTYLYPTLQAKSSAKRQRVEVCLFNYEQLSVGV